MFRYSCVLNCRGVFLGGNNKVKMGLKKFEKCKVTDRPTIKHKRVTVREDSSYKEDYAMFFLFPKNNIPKTNLHKTHSLIQMKVNERFSD